MITIEITNEDVILPDGTKTKKRIYYGKSTDPKPTEGVYNMAPFYEADTVDTYMFDEETKDWLKQKIG